MAKIVLATPEIGDSGSFGTVGSAAASMPATNLQTHQPGERWRATNLGAAYFTLDLGAAREIDLIALLYTNATSAATWRIRAAATEAGTVSAPDYDSTAISLWPTTGLGDWPYVHAFEWLGGASETRRWWRIDIDDSGNPDGFFDAGRLYLAKAWQPSVNRQYGLRWEYADNLQSVRSRSGGSFAGDGGRWRVLQYALENIPEAEIFAQAFARDRLFGREGDVFVIVDPENAAQAMNQSIYGRQRALAAIENYAFAVHRRRFEIEEVLP